MSTNPDLQGLPDGTVVKNSPVNAGDAGDTGSIPGSERPLGRRNGNPLQYSCLENSMDRGAWQAAAHGVAKSVHACTRVCTHTHTHLLTYRHPGRV